MCSIPRWARARPTCVRRRRSGAPPATGVCTAQWARSVYRAVGGGHDGHDAFPAVPEFGMEQALGGVVDGDEGEPLLGDEGEPAMATAVEMQQLAEARPGRPAAPVAAAGAVLGHEPGALQGLLDEGVGEADAVLTTGEGVEV